MPDVCLKPTNTIREKNDLEQYVHNCPLYLRLSSWAGTGNAGRVITGSSFQMHHPDKSEKIYA
jgi:hypothetical protein